MVAVLRGSNKLSEISVAAHLQDQSAAGPYITADPTLNIDSPRQWKVLPNRWRPMKLKSGCCRGPRGQKSICGCFSAGQPRDPARCWRCFYAGALRVLGGRQSQAGRPEARPWDMSWCAARGNKERIVPLVGAAQEIVQEYLRDARPALAAGKSSRRTCLCARGEGHTRQRVWQMVSAASAQSRHASPHMLRQSCARAHMVEKARPAHGADDLGHADISTTQVYRIWRWIG